MTTKDLVKKLLAILFLLIAPLFVILMVVFNFLKSANLTQGECNERTPKDIYDARLKSTFTVLNKMTTDKVKEQFHVVFGKKK
jgi:uncharacterized protein YpmS